MKASLRVALEAIAIVAVLGLPQSGHAWGLTYHVQVPSGKPTRIFIFMSCATHQPWYGAAFVEHGAVAYKDVTLKKCGSDREPAREVWYTSTPGYKGTDTVTFPSGPTSAVLYISVQ
jgi:hypothetical protein